ncbi:flagellar brake protein [Pseudomonas sp. Marseille-QA0892]
MSTLFAQNDGPQPPRILKTAVEVQANLRTLLEGRDPLVISFEGRGQLFQSFVVAVDKERGVYALDEIIPNAGERFITNGEPFKVHGYHDGVKIAWSSDGALQVGELSGAKCYWGYLPAEVIYYQRRNAFRVSLKLSELVDVDLGGKRLSDAISGQMLDISATGCRIRFPGNVTDRIQPGQVYDTFTARLPFGALTMAIELRHCHYSNEADKTFAGIRFHRMSGLEQRNVERFVYQLQREARRVD